MTVIDQVKIINNKIKTNQAQYDFDSQQLKYLHTLLAI